MYAHNFMESAMSLASLRAQYQTVAQPILSNGRVDPAVKDINSYELQYYGKINKRGIPIFLNEENLVSINSSQEYIGDKNHLVLPFIKQMHQRMKTNIQMKITAGILPMTSNQISTMEPVLTYISPKYQYTRYLERLFINFNSSMDDTTNNSITHYEDYVNQFYNYLNSLPERTPITFSGWMVSKESSIFSSGLAISISNNQYDRDDTNTEFMSNFMFSYYKKLAMNTGFCIVKQAPHILIADLNSPAILPYYDGEHDSDSVLIRHYSSCYYEDIQLLYNNLIKYYNDIVLFNDETKEIRITCKNRTKRIKKIRKPISDNDNFYRDPKKYIKFYVDMRNRESGYPLTPLVLKQIEKKYQNIVDIYGLVGYVNSIFARELFRKPFGLADTTRRFDKRVESETGIGPTQQKSQQAIQTGTSTFGGGSSGGGMSGGGSSGGY